MSCPVPHNVHSGERPNGTIKTKGEGKSASGEYIRWDAKGVEVIPDNEQEKIKAVSGQFKRFQMMNFNEHHHCLRGTHLKTQGVGDNPGVDHKCPADPELKCVVGKFIVPELPPHLGQGMFKKPGSYDVIMRYSSLTPKLVPDNIPAPRGIGMKIFGVEGEKIWVRRLRFEKKADSNG